MATVVTKRHNSFDNQVFHNVAASMFNKLHVYSMPASIGKRSANSLGLPSLGQCIHYYITESNNQFLIFCPFC